MARVVTRRKNPPYLMIVFAVLFVLATGAAIMLYLEMDKAQQALTLAQGNVNDLEGQLETSQKNTAELARLITGKSNLDFSQIVSEVEEGYQKRKAVAENIKNQYKNQEGINTDETFLIDAMNTLANQYQSSLQTIAKQNKDAAAANEQMAAVNADKASLISAHDKKLQELSAQLSAAKKELASVQKEREGDQEKTKSQLESLRAGLDKKINELDTKLQDYMLKLSEKNGEISKLKKQIEDLKSAGRGPVTIANKTDGRVEKVIAKDGICYINVGKKQGVKPGMTFAVYDRGADNEDKPKGALRVTGVKDAFSECKILATKENDPITTGDNVANIVFHNARTYTFVVEGLFDMGGKGRATKEGKEEVIGTIRRFGGKVADGIDYQTDYIVLGEEPEKPQAPSGDASATTHKAYQNQLKSWKTYSDIRVKAEAQKIPILNKYRFLEMTGYMPEKKPE